MQALGSTGIKVIRSEVNPIARAVKDGLGAPTSVKLIEAGKMPKVPSDRFQPTSTDKPGSTLSPTDTQLLSSSVESNLSSSDIIGGSTVLRQTFRPKGTQSESSVETTPAKKGETEPGVVTGTSHRTRMEGVVQSALTKPLAKPESSEQHISQVLSRSDHMHNLMDLASTAYSVQPARYPLSSTHARAMSTLAEKEQRLETHEVEDPAVVKAHLDKFRRDGAVCLIPAASREKFCKTHLGHAGDNAQFVLNKAQFDGICKIVGREGGTRAQMEARLEELCGIPKGSWKDLYVAEYKEKNLDKLGLRFVSGKETLANHLYGAGGVTRGIEEMELGMDEAILNRVSVDEVTWSPVTDYITSKLETTSTKQTAPKPAPEPSIPVSSMSVQYPTVLR